MATPTNTTTESTQTSEPGRWRVRSSFPTDRKRVLFSSVSESRAKRFIVNRFPRGEEAYLEGPDSSTQSYAEERTDEYGVETEKWVTFDPEAWRPPEEQEPPGQSAWGDVEG